VGIKYETVLGHSKTRRITGTSSKLLIELHKGLKFYFFSQIKYSKVLCQFFSKKKSFIFFLFLKTQVRVSYASLQIELMMQQNEMCLCNDVKMELTNLHGGGLMTQVSSKKYMSNCCTTAGQCNLEWSVHPFISLSTSSCWKNVEDVL
jgi:hypothetical protein